MKTHLHQLHSNSDSPLYKAVIQIILDTDEPKAFISDVLTYGCISGVVTELIYYADTQAFYDNHCDEIEALRHEYETETGTTMQTDGDYKNYMVWFAFEAITLRISWELGL